MEKQNKSFLPGTALAVLVSFAVPGAFAHADAKPAHTKPARAVAVEEHAFGQQGNPKKVSRTIAIDMTDMMRFTPADITVKQGETIKFVLKNKGKMLHEMVIGTPENLKAHAAIMQKHPGMEHAEPYMAHVRPGRREHLVWQFTKVGEFTYACLVPGHFEAGMFGKIKVVKG